MVDFLPLLRRGPGGFFLLPLYLLDSSSGLNRSIYEGLNFPLPMRGKGNAKVATKNKLIVPCFNRRAWLRACRLAIRCWPHLSRGAGGLGPDCASLPG